VCPVCGTKIFKIGATAPAEQAPAPTSEPGPGPGPGPTFAATGAEEERTGGGS
jgi:hypothetical protein